MIEPRRELNSTWFEKGIRRWGSARSLFSRRHESVIMMWWWRPVIDLASAPRVEVALEPFVGQPVVFDLRGVEFMDSAGLKVLLQQRSRIQESGAT